MKQIVEEYGDKVAWVYRHYPLPFHPNAQKAAEGVECVVKQKGKAAFWTYADQIIAKQDELGGKLTPEAITEVAQAQGVNMTAFEQCLESGEFADKVTEDMNGGSGAGITGTPGTIIITKDGDYELIPGALTFEQVKPMLDKYL
jgi:protein-disulfide isomerase